MKKGRTKDKIKDWKKEERGPILSEITPRRSAQILSSPMSPAKENDLSVDLIEFKTFRFMTLAAPARSTRNAEC